jgi:hypothetical protein
LAFSVLVSIIMLHQTTELNNSGVHDTLSSYAV